MVNLLLHIVILLNSNIPMLTINVFVHLVINLAHNHNVNKKNVYLYNLFI